jgi:hypothetical protein
MEKIAVSLIGMNTQRILGPLLIALAVASVAHAQQPSEAVAAQSAAAASGCQSAPQENFPAQRKLHPFA